MRHSTQISFILFLGLLVVSAGWNTGCLPSMPESAIKPINLTQDRIDLSVVKGRSNISYIPINQRGMPNQLRETILDLVQKFGEAHPDWEIKNVNIEAWPLLVKPENKDDVEPIVFTYGLWVVHEPKAK